MAVNSVRAPYPAFLDTDGNALEGGNIYIGEISQNPLTSPKQVYWDESLMIPATQPIRTVGGIPHRNNSPARFYVENDYSIAVYTSTGTLVYTADVDISETTPSANNYVSIATVGPATGLDVTGKEVVFCNTGSNDVGISGFTGGVTGQSLSIIKTSSSNSLNINHNAGTGNQDIFLHGARSIEVDDLYDVSGGIDVIFDGTIWRQKGVDIRRKRVLTVTDAGPTDDLDVSGVDTVICNTASNNVTIGGTTGAVTNQRIAFVKINAANVMRIEDNKGTGNQDFLNFNALDRVVDATEGYGGVIYTFNGTAWVETATQTD